MKTLNEEQKKLMEFSGRIWGRSGLPDHADNANDADWQAGFEAGSNPRHGSGENVDVIGAEWRRRGSPPHDDEERQKPFRSWKAGYWAGIFCRLGEEHQP